MLSIGLNIWSLGKSTQYVPPEPGENDALFVDNGNETFTIVRMPDLSCITLIDNLDETFSVQGWPGGGTCVAPIEHFRDNRDETFTVIQMPDLSGITLTDNGREQAVVETWHV